jgi:drug/metabolite transporter (DMT)-like permease
LSCIVLLTIASLFFPRTNIKEYLSDNYKTILITGVGLFITYIGFYLLYSRFGASYYILYAVLSIVTTSIIVGVVYFREGFNIYYALSILSSIFTILFFYLGKYKV